MGHSSLLPGSWKRSGGSALRTGGRRIITRKATATSNGSTGRPPGARLFRECPKVDRCRFALAVSIRIGYNAALAYAALVADHCGTNLTGQDLRALTLAPGV